MFKKTKKSIGLEINDYAIRVVELIFKDDEWRIGGTNEIMLEAGVVENGLIRNKRALTSAVKKAFFDAYPKAVSSRDINFALPPELLKIHVFKTELSLGKGIKQAVDKELTRFEELERTEMDYSFRVIDTKQGPGYTQLSTVVLAMAAKENLLSWQDFFVSMGLKLSYFDAGSLAVYRGFYEERQAQNLGILNIDKRGSRLSLFSNYGLEKDTLLPIGLELIMSDFVGTAISGKEIALEAMEQSEELNSLIKSASEALQNAASHSVGNDGAIRGSNLAVGNLILCGEGAELRSIRDYFRRKLTQISFLESKVRGFADDSGLRYATALGLAMRGEGGDWEKSDPILLAIAQRSNLRKSLDSGKSGIGQALVFLKKLILYPLFIVLFGFGIWLLSGAISTSIEDSMDNQLPENQVTTRDANIPVDPEDEAIKEEANLGKEAGKEELGQKNSLPVEEKLAEKESREDIPAADEEKAQKLIVNNDIGRPLNIRKGPGTSFPIVGEAKEGSELLMLEEKNGWFKIEWGAVPDAWVSGEYVKKK